MRNWINSALSILIKDINLEVRSRYALNTVLVFVLTSTLVILFAVGIEDLSDQIISGLIWIIVLFAALSTLARSFVSEAERGTMDLLRLHTHGTEVLAGKLIFNFLLTLVVTIPAFFIFFLLLGVSIHNFALLVTAILLGTLGLAGVSTLLGALISQASRKGTIFSVISLPLLVPLILLLVRVTEAAITTEQIGGTTDDILAIIGFGGTTITASFILFEYIWQD